MTHTPGPWEIQAIDEEGEMRGCVSIIGSNLGGLVGAAMPWPTELDTGDFARVKDNARLISAAPDLLALAKEMLVAIEEDKSIVASTAFESDDTEWFIERCRAAISKAESA